MASNNLAATYWKLAALEERRVERETYLRIAVKTIEKAVRVFLQSNRHRDMGVALTTASYGYAMLAELEPTREARLTSLTTALEAVEQAINIQRRERRSGPLAAALSLASDHYCALAEAAASRATRRRYIRKAVNAAVDAVAIYRAQRCFDQMARSLSTAALRRCDAARIATTPNDRETLLRDALGQVEEAVQILRRFREKTQLAAALVDSSIVFSEIAALKPVEERNELLKRAARTAEEAASSYRTLGLHCDVARALDNVSLRYLDLARSGDARLERSEWLQHALKASEEAIRIWQGLGLPNYLIA